MTRVLYRHPLRWLDADPAPLTFIDPALAEHPEARALLEQLNTARQFEAEAGRELRSLQAEVERLRNEFDEGVETYLEAQAEMLWEGGRAA